ncbi:hypothetical protein ABIB57_001957 [Devosia sp. UYZn731]|uniref:DUF1353 domain-containing protein n=1 Tax=Devosia sp. UYZn731 TaxID=3156345 RepID=UPI0033926A06
MYTRFVPFLLLSAVASIVPSCGGEFTRGPVFLPQSVPCDAIYEPGTICRQLAASFGYTQNGVGWEAGKGLITDGASIPSWGRWLIGQPLDEAFAKAATLHDHYCRENHQVRDYLSTHRMFYDALIDSGMDSVKAGVMYAAVLVGGPKWSQLVPGEECEVLDNDICVRANPTVLTIDGAKPSTNVIEAKYDELPMEALTKEFAARIESEKLTPEEIQQMALGRRIELGYSLPSLAVVAP